MARNFEIKRKIIHIFFGLPVLLYKFLPYEYILAIAVLAIVHNIFIAPFYMKSVFKQNKRFDLGIIIYPIAVLIFIIIFKNNPIYASFLWITLSFGDGFSGLIGVLFGKTRLKYNKEKSLEGFFGGFLFSFMGMFLIYLFLKSDFPQTLNFHEIMILIFLLSVLTSFAETLPFKINDNIVVPFAGFIILFIFLNSSGFSFYKGVNKYYILYSLFLLLFAIGSYLLKFLDFRGATASFFIGFFIMILSGVFSLLLLIIFFIISIIATKFRYKEKKQKGIAEENAGTRGLSSVLPKGIIPLYVSLLIGFHQNNRFYIAMFITVIATALFDTVSSEIGKGLRAKTFSLLKFKIVKAGEKGGISTGGTIAGFVSILLLYVFAYYFGMIKTKYLTLMIIIPFISNLLEPYYYFIIKKETIIKKPIVNSLNLLSSVALMIAFNCL